MNGQTVEIRPLIKRYVKTLRIAIGARKRAQVSEQFLMYLFLKGNFLSIGNENGRMKAAVRLLR
jgi:hypothetical protein